MSTRWIRFGDFVQSWSRAISAAAVAEGVDKAAAAAIARTATEELLKLHAGNTVYITRGKVNPEERARRARALRDGGLPVRDIAARLSLSTQRVYQLFAMKPAEPAPLKNTKVP